MYHPPFYSQDHFPCNVSLSLSRLSENAKRCKLIRIDSVGYEHVEFNLTETIS